MVSSSWLLLYTVDRGGVLRAGFVASGGGRDESSVSSVGEPRVVGSAGDSHTVAQDARAYGFMVVRGQLVRLRAPHLIGSRSAGA